MQLLLDKDPKLEFVVPVKATDKMDTDEEQSGPVTAILKVKRAKRPIVKGADLKKAPNAGPYEGEKRKFSDENTVFLKNLAFKADESALRAFITATSKVVPKEVRIPVDAHGKSKGIAYVECEKSEDVPTLIADLDNKDLMGLNVKAEKSNPTRPRAKLATPAPV
jgi:RNA recognition motif-containing protein